MTERFPTGKWVKEVIRHSRIFERSNLKYFSSLAQCLYNEHSDTLSNRITVVEVRQRHTLREVASRLHNSDGTSLESIPKRVVL